MTQKGADSNHHSAGEGAKHFSHGAINLSYGISLGRPEVLIITLKMGVGLDIYRYRTTCACDPLLPMFIWRPVWVYTNMIQISEFKIQISTNIDIYISNTDICILNTDICI